ncbi:MAG: hypothetical protein NVV82_19510 [Sporocytophaga sp.]|nr:hypothetical protein [Sporocytophaga sp.]
MASINIGLFLKNLEFIIVCIITRKSIDLLSFIGTSHRLAPEQGVSLDYLAGEGINNSSFDKKNGATHSGD